MKKWQIFYEKFNALDHFQKHFQKAFSFSRSANNQVLIKEFMLELFGKNLKNAKT